MLELSGRRFEWDEDKYEINRNKHGITFNEAATAFLDDNAIEFYDDNHSHNEERFILIGKSKRLRILVVCHCYRENDTIIRIISARRAEKQEAELYGGAI